VVPYAPLLIELEEAVAHGTQQRRADTLRHVTDLFVLGLAHYSDDQIALFDDVFVRLCAKIERSARVLLASRLAEIRNAPPATIRTLAFDDAIEVAGPVLSRSERLDTATLVDNARTKSQQHLLAISRRTHLDAALTDVLVVRGDRSVVLRTAENPGARFSDAGYRVLVERAHDDDNLATCVGTRRDVPRHLFLKLLARASDAVRRKLEATDPLHANEIRAVVSAVATTIQARSSTDCAGWRAAGQLIAELKAAGRLGDGDVAALAAAGNFAATTAALAALSELPIEAVESAMVQDRAEMILILAKALDLTWQTTKAILLMRGGARSVSGHDLDQCLASFTRLKPTTARQVLQFQRLRGKA
jgi:uncharacterized protein (DUF2336 family)